MVSLRNKGKSIIDIISDYTVIDLETTNKSITYAEIIEMAAVKVRNGEIIDTYNTLIKPSRLVSSVVTALTGITNEMLSDAPEIKDKMQEYLDFIGDDIILGHNIASYDSTILYDVCEKLKLKQFNNDMLDTLRFIQHRDIDVPDHRLITLTEYFGIEYKAHRALNDCIANFHVYEKLKEKYTLNSHSCSISEQYADISGKSIVLTGDFQIGKRDDVKTMLEELGASVKSGVSSKTSYLILGSLGGYGSKLTKAEELQANGKPVEIIKEEDFFV